MKFEFTRPALIASISYLILGLIILLPFGNTYITDPSQPKPQNPLGYRLLLLITMLIPIALSIYSINCMMVGRCVIWSYVQAIAIALWVILFVTATLISSENQNQVI